jgi:NAD(P)-dependent dehydrogenase (short-subunit alcohol dehydrogenase family)
MQKFSNVCVFGAGHGIGLGIVSQLMETSKAQVFAFYRRSELAGDLLVLQQKYPQRLFAMQLKGVDEESIADAAKKVASDTPTLCALINCIGFLHDQQTMPEKKLADISSEALVKSFQVNSVAVALIAKEFFPFFKNPDPSYFVSLSARVGSIADNRSGGWYSYRASKAAHNMLVKNIGLEFERYRCNTLTLAIHPGTTRTNLSKPFLANTKYQIHSPEQSAQNILKVTSSRTWDHNLGFFDWKGERVEW